MANFFTFYSFKGGVGRSMALANVADILARRGLRVLAIDFDLEAPGLERYFQVEKNAALANPGLIDLLQSFKKSLSGADAMDDTARFRQLERFIFPVFQRPLPNGGELNLLTAGQREPAAQYRQYALAVRTFDWQDFYYNWEGEAFFDWLRNELAQPADGRRGYDVVLVDSRTGVTEMGGVCAYQLADVIVMLCAANHQNVEGTREVARDFRSESVRALRRGRPLEMVVVPARIEKRDEALLDKFFQRFNEFFRDEEPVAFNAANLSFRDLTIPYQPEYAFEEIVVSDPERRETRRDIGGAFERLADALTLLAPAGETAGLGAQHDDALASLQAILGNADEAIEELPEDVDEVIAYDSAEADAAPAGQPAADSPLRKLSPLKGRKAAAPATHFDPTRSFAGYDVFLSFDRDDQRKVQELNEALIAAGLSTFMTTSALTPGDQIAESTAQAIHHSRFLLVCAGSRGIGVWQKREIELAQSSNQAIRIVPVLLPGAEQDIFSLALRGVANMQALDLRHWPDDNTAFNQLVALLRDAAPVRNRETSTPAKVDNPYAGLAAYDEGRVHLLDLPENQLATLLAKLRETGLAVLVGASGVGKGSLVAALIARLRESGNVPRILRTKLGAAEARQIIETPPLENQLLIVEDFDHLPLALDPPARISLWPAALSERVRRASPAFPLLLVGNDLPLEAWRNPPSPDAALWLRLHAESTLLPAPDVAAVRRAIETPAMRSGYAFEPGLLDRIAADAGDGPPALPLAQLALTRLWPNAVRGFLTNAAYDACGGIGGLYAAFVDDRLNNVPPALAAAVDALLLRLIAVADDGTITWQSAVWEHLRSMPELGDQGGEALLWLIEQRVVSVWRASSDQLMFALLRPLGSGQGLQLYALINRHTEQLIRRRRLTSSLGIWLERKREPHALLTGYRLDDALLLEKDWAEHLSNEEHIFIARSRERARARRRNLLAVLALIILAGAAGMWLSVQRADTYEKNLTVAQSDLQAAKKAVQATIEQPIESALFADATIYTQYRDAADKTNVNALLLLMEAVGLKAEPSEWVKDSPTCGEVRFLHADDAARAQELADITSRLLKKLGYRFELNISDLSRTRFAKSRPGTLEIWLPPLRSLKYSGPAETVNNRDGAEINLVPGECARLGSRPEIRQELAQQLQVPYAKIYDNDLPETRTWVDGFLMYRHEVTHRQYGKFLEACGNIPGADCTAPAPVMAKPLEPVRFVSWKKADAYCRWAGGRLPTESEWEKAARGDDGRTWPWGEAREPDRYLGRETSGGKFIAEVGRYPKGDSPYGMADMAGNVWEMTSTPWPGGGHVMKGGSYLNPLFEVRPAWRWVSSAEDKGADYLGFRCVIDIPATNSVGGGNF